MTEIVAHPTEDGELCFLITFTGGGIVDAPMDAFCITRKHWTILVSVIAHDYIIEFLSGKLINGF